MSDLLVSAEMIEELSEFLPAYATQVLLYLNAKSLERKKEAVAISQYSLASATGVTRDQVRRSLKTLAERGFIVVNSTKRKTLIHTRSILQILRRTPIERPENTQIPPTEHPPATQEGVPPSDSPFTKKSMLIVFEDIWKTYPKRVGKKEALRHFQSSVESQEQIEALKAALANYKQSDRFKSGFIQDGSTWFNNWQDWIPAAAASPKEPARRPPEPDPVRDMSIEEMKEIRRKNIPQLPVTKPPTPDVVASEVIPAEDVNDVVLRLAGGVRRMPK